MMTALAVLAIAVTVLLLPLIVGPDSRPPHPRDRDRQRADLRALDGSDHQAESRSASRST